MVSLGISQKNNETNKRTDLDDEVNIEEKLDLGDFDDDLFSSWEIDDSIKTVGVMMQDSHGSGNVKK